MQNFEKVTHTFEPVYNVHSKILILGSLPSVKSREKGFYYGHAQNRFWKLLALLYERELPKTIEEKINMLLSCQVAIWDVIKSCEIIGSSDSSIQNVVPMDLNQILRASDIKQIYANGKTAARLYRTYHQELTGREIIELPSTSPANATYSLDRLVENWRRITIPC